MSCQPAGEAFGGHQPATIRRQFLLILIGVGMLATLIACLVFYVHHRGWLLDGIDEKLTAVAIMARENLPPDYHDRIVGPESVPEAEFERLVERNNRLCERLDLEYIWSLMVVDGQIVFTSSTSPDKVVENRRHAAFFEPHSNPELYAGTFASMQATYQSIHDKWGDIRVALIPGEDRQGRKFLFGASVRLTEVHRRLWVVIWELIVFGAAAFALSVVVSWWVAKLVATPIQRLTETIGQIAAGQSQLVADERGSYEQVSLARCFNQMNRALQGKIVDLQAAQRQLISDHRNEIMEAEESRLASEQRYHGLLDFAVDGILLGTPEGYVVEANQRMCELFDRSRAEIVGQHIATMPFTPESLQANPLQFERVRRGEMVITERVVRRRDGSEIVVEMHTKMMPDGSYQSIYHDISERKQAERALRDSEERYRQLFEMESDAILLVDNQDGRILDANLAAQAMYGFSRQELLAKRNVDLSAEPEQTRQATRTGAARQTDLVQIPVRRHRKKDGTVFAVEITGRFFAIGQRSVHIAAIRDITERQQAQQLLESWSVTLEQRVKQRTAEVEHYARQLKSLTGKLLRAEEDERRRLSYMLHEDLQQLLVAARMTLGSVRQMVKKATGKELLVRLDVILEQALRLTRSIVHDISVPAVREGDLGAAIGWLAQQAKEKFALTVTLTCDAETPRLGEDAYLCLYRAVQELLFNVVKHAGCREAAVVVRCGAAGHLEVAVRDWGCGLRQPLATSGPPHNGGGFGLFSIGERVEALGGRMTVASIEGEGLTVILSIPVAPAETETMS